MQIFTVPGDGTPAVIDNAATLKLAIAELQDGSGPIAIDAERASGYRYSSRAYLIQLYRRDGGLHLIDPIPLIGSAEVAVLDDLIQSAESVIHASSQDLECLRDFGINPVELFDTELGARIAGCERVGLGALCESLLGIQIAKEHSAVDWSIRPLKQEWLDYAALDVAVLLDIRDAVEKILIESGKLDWARQEFANSLRLTPPKVRKNPWRRTSGMHQIKSRFELALIRELWMARDLRAQELDLAPGRLLSDAVIVDLAKHKPEKLEDMLALPIIKERIRNDLQRSHLKEWWKVLSGAYQIDQDHWPEMRARGESIPHPKIWREKFPVAFMHLQHARLALAELATEKRMPVENLVSPESVRNLIFDEARERVIPFSQSSKGLVVDFLKECGARPWQIELVSELLARALSEHEPPVAAPAVVEE